MPLQKPAMVRKHAFIEPSQNIHSSNSSNENPTQLSHSQNHLFDPWFGSVKKLAPGEARTHGLQIMRLTRCLLRYGGFNYSLLNFLTCPNILNQQQKKSLYTHGGTRTPNLRFRRPTPYPLGHAGILNKLSSL